MEETYKVKLADGTELCDLDMNGNNYISKTPISKGIFENNCSPVIISCGEEVEIHPAMDVIHVTKMDQGYWFALRDLTESELRAIKIRSDIEYLALMCDIEL